MWAKVGGETWRDGTAVSYALRIENLQRFPLPTSLTTSEIVSNLLTFGTLALELSLGLLVWNRNFGRGCLLAGVSLHLGIDYAIRVGFFSYAVLVLYIAFIPPETMDRWILALREASHPVKGDPSPEPGGCERWPGLTPFETLHLGTSTSPPATIDPHAGRLRVLAFPPVAQAERSSHIDHVTEAWEPRLTALRRHRLRHIHAARGGFHMQDVFKAVAVRLQNSWFRFRDEESARGSSSTP